MHQDLRLRFAAIGLLTSLFNVIVLDASTVFPNFMSLAHYSKQAYIKSEVSSDGEVSNQRVKVMIVP